MTTLVFTHPECRLHDMGRGHPECGARLDAISDHLRATGLDAALLFRDAPLVDAEALRRAHTAGYVYLPAAIGVAVASVLAAPYGTRLAHAISGSALKRVFAVFMVVVGAGFAWSAMR